MSSLLQFSVINVGPYLFGCHLSTLLWWEAAALAIVIIHHSGYEVPGDNLPYVGSLSHFHDYHHKVFNKNFGTVGALDLLFGTCGGWEEHRQAWAEERRVKAKQI